MADINIEGLSEHDFDLDRADIDSSTSETQLAEWFVALIETAEEIKEFITARRFADVADDDWLRRASGKVAYCMCASKWVERRMLRLGFDPPYFPNDPRGQEIYKLNKRVAVLNAELAAKTT